MNHNGYFKNRTDKIIALLLAFMLAFTALSWDMPTAYAADEANTEAQPAETSPPPEEPQPSGPPQAPDASSPSEEPLFPSVTPQTSEAMQAAEAPDIITDANGTQYARDEVIVKFKSTASDSAIMSTLDAADSDVLNTLEAYGLTIAEVPAGETVESFIGDLEALPNVEYAEPNYVYKVAETVSDPRFSEQWYLNKISVPSAWNLTMGLPDIKVAVLDTGIDLSHPEFNGQIYLQTDTADNDGNANDIIDGHGTHVAGIIAGKANNGMGISGVAPGVQLIVVDVFDGDDAFVIDIIEGIDYAVDHGADVINMSLGGFGTNISLENAINDAVSAGVVCVVAAGNKNSSAPFTPSDCTGAISVIATDENDQRASFSNYGALKDISAPGTAILSTYPVGGYEYLQGTSMAAPVVTGVVALMRSLNPEMSVDQIKTHLYATAIDLGAPGKDDQFANGRVDAYDVLLNVREPLPSYIISVDKTLLGSSDSNYGNVTGGGSYKSRTKAVLQAVPNAGYHFVRWTEDGVEVSTSATYSHLVTKNSTLIAEFEKDVYIISPVANNSNFGSVSGGGSFYYGDSVTVTATPNTDCFFTGWVENGITVSTDPTYTFTATKSTTIEAVFAPSSFTVTAVPNNPSYGSVSGGGTYNMSQQIVLEATPFPGHRFVRWMENGVEISSYYRYGLGVASNRSIIAEFVPFVPISVSCTKTDATYHGGSNGTITVTPSGGESGRYFYSIDGKGLYASNTFTGLRAGTYTITVCDWNFNKNITSCTVTVGEPFSNIYTPAKKLPNGVSAGYRVTIIPPAAPKGYSTQSVTFTSSNPSVAVVDATGNVTFLAGGKATIITKVVSQTVDKKGRVKTKTTTVRKTITVKQPVASVSLNLGDTTIARTQKVKLIPSIAPATASNKNVKWSTSNKKVATVSSSGVVTGKAGGTAVITCTAQDGSRVSASCTVNVTPIYTTGIKISKAALTVKLNKTASLKATVMPRNTDFKTVTWASSDSSIVTVDAKGKLKGIAPGTAVITATASGGQTASCTVTVP